MARDSDVHPCNVRQSKTKTDDDTERQLVHTLAHAIVFDLLSLELHGRNIFGPFFSNGPAHQSQAGPICDEPPTNLNVTVGVKASNGNRDRSGGSRRGRAGGDGDAQ